MSRQHYQYFHTKSYVKPTSNDIPDFWTFEQKFTKLKHRNKLKHSSEKNKLGLPTEFNPIHTIPFICVSDKEKDCGRSQDSDDFHETIRHFVQFKTKQSFGKIRDQILYKKQLPIYKFRDAIIDHVQRNPITIIAGDTGCGKSTQVAQYLLEAGYQSIACTQPRRIACVSLAKRVSVETFNQYGQEIGYQVRFDQMTYAQTKLRFLTEGLLLRQLQNDPCLHAYDIVILDEVHERHLHGDLLLGILKGVIEQRPELRVVLMSATMNLELFSAYLPDAPLVQVPGRVFPVEVRYCPTHERSDVKPSSSKINPKPYVIILQLIDTRYTKDERGDLLIFASGLAEIMALVEAVQEYSAETGNWIVLPLHSSLSVEEQQKVFDYPPAGVRKCIVSTNIAETSLTIDGVRFIIDSGKFKEMAYDSTKKLQRLQEFWVSKASAEQRKGRAGRTGPGVCFRLYSEEDFQSFVDYPTPEILRVPLDTLILQLVSMGIDVRAFPFLQQPPTVALVDSLAFLQQQGALASEDELSPIGHVLARLPVEVALGKLLFSAAVLGVLDPALTIAAGLSIQSLFNKTQCNSDELKIRADLESSRGDLFVILNIYEEWSQKKSQGVNTRRWCRVRGLKEQQLYEMSKLRHQFRGILKENLQLEQKENDDDEDRDKLKDIQRLKWKKKLEEPSRKMLKTEFEGGKKRPEEEEEEEEGERTEDKISSLEYFLTKSTPNLDLSCSVRDTLNLLSVFGLYPNLAISDPHNREKRASDYVFHTRKKGFVVLHPNCIFNTLDDELYPSNTRSEQILAYSTLLETNKPYLTNVTRVQGLTGCLLICKEIATNDSCTDIVCDQWLRFTVKEHGQKVVHTAAKIRKQWEKLVERVLQHKLEDKSSFLKTQKKLQRAISSFLRTELFYTMRALNTGEISGLVKYESSVKLTDNICVNAVQESSTSSLDSLLQRPWTCPLCGVKGLYSVVEKSAHLAECGEEEDEVEEIKKDEAVPVPELSSSGVPRKHYHCDTCNEMFEFTNVEILKHVRSHKAG